MIIGVNIGKRQEVVTHILKTVLKLSEVCHISKQSGSQFSYLQQNWVGPSYQGFPDSSAGKDSTCNAGHPVQFLGWEDLLEKRQAIHASILGLPLWLSW